MQIKLIVSMAAILFSSPGYLLAHEGIKHDEGMESMDHQQEAMAGHQDTAKSKVVEVGNKICPVSGEVAGEMGDIVKYEYNGKMYNLCCKACAKDFKKDPEKYSKIAEGEAAKD